MKYIFGTDYEGRKFKWTIERPIFCDSTNIVYLLECDKDNCRQKYIGITHQKLRDRIYQHVAYVRNKHLNRATGEHFNRPGHGVENMKFTVLEKVKSSDPLYGREREKLLIRKFNTFHSEIKMEP